MSKTKKTVVTLLIIAALIAVIPLFTLKGAEFGGSDDAGSEVVSQITGGEYKPWVKPVMETWIGGELPGEVESLIFCVQTGIGVGVIAFFMGRFVERKKIENEKNKNK
ncbi:energy-coupling factor ABC transporter substrate-binding protein [Clostridium saccharobutylicum]|uniref:Cobalt transport protein CbiN n=1 Tax=Clostridium saccharobutylicum DSM 13864 TaxID=1345695 RepID=U5MTW4_CLOSA|nr:cobalt transport protein CbiN [Clostridium saccharobutylicum]AGX44239.1 cobalt transport protein CbiN [Clostridium saccharobutylicum DSM 13864]AQR91528.1 cobalt transport protein CbiN [Clostridium saccharobutylicum]AQS01433.1 cobalt transport protein CbiN [Clostridium saccharobutylicum]AQS11042.1 cobalt transport protein CbiN [Clostridium saccharobutylicum]AQS15416.1 cobalt transport protein CbiN [Clostridium saccharobutylicum]